MQRHAPPHAVWMKTLLEATARQREPGTSPLSLLGNCHPDFCKKAMRFVNILAPGCSAQPATGHAQPVLLDSALQNCLAALTQELRTSLRMPVRDKHSRVPSPGTFSHPWYHHELQERVSAAVMGPETTQEQGRPWWAQLSNPTHTQYQKLSGQVPRCPPIRCCGLHADTGRIGSGRGR